MHAHEYTRRCARTGTGRPAQVSAAETPEQPQAHGVPERRRVVSDNVLQSTRSRSIHDIEGVAIAKIKELTHYINITRESERDWWPDH